MFFGKSGCNVPSCTTGVDQFPLRCLANSVLPRLYRLVAARFTGQETWAAAMGAEMIRMHAHRGMCHSSYQWNLLPAGVVSKTTVEEVCRVAPRREHRLGTVPAALRIGFL
jgi:hypothetical protein